MTQSIGWQKILLFLIVAGLLLVLFVKQSASNERFPEDLASLTAVYYVSPSGKDSNPGTISLPWQTIQKAANTLVAGNTVYIRAGTYTEQVVPQNSGSPGSPITYAAYPGETATIDGSSITLPDDLYGVFHISNKSYITVSGLRVVNAGPHGNNAGIMALNSNHIIVENNTTYNTNSSGIGVWGSSNVTVNNNRVEEANGGGWQECITFAGTDTFAIYNNEVVNCYKEGICIKHGSANGQVYGNHVHDTQHVGIYVDAWDTYTHDIAVFQNVVHDLTEGDGFAVASEAGGLLQNIHIYNNIAYHNRFIGFSVTSNGDSGPMQNIYVVNNTAYNNGWEWGGGIAVNNSNALNVVVRNNIVSQNNYFQLAADPGVPTQNYVIDHNLIDGFRDHEDEGELRGLNYIEGDPRFFDAASANFYLQADSPAIDAGTAVDAPSTDFDGRIRPLDGDNNGSALYDIGAYEMPFFSERLYLPVIIDNG